MISSEEMKALEDRSEKAGVSKSELMENAGKAFFEIVKDRCSARKITIFCGSGNNGGDGFVIARYLSDIAKVNVLFLGDEAGLTKESKPNFEKIKNNSAINIITDLEKVEDCDVCIDAMLGTGIQGEIRDPIKSAILKFNSLKGMKFCVDIPSGIDPDTGEESLVYCYCDLLVTFHDIKKGLVALDLETVVVDIGIPGEAVKQE